MRFTPSKADQDVWIRPVEGNSCYEYIANVEDLAISTKNPKKIMDDLQCNNHFKLEGTRPLTNHLGCTYIRDPDGTLVADPTKYIKKFLESYKHTFGSNQKRLKHSQTLQSYPVMSRSRNTRPSSDK